MIAMLSTRTGSPVETRICRLLSSDGGVNVAEQVVLHALAVEKLVHITWAPPLNPAADLQLEWYPAETALDLRATYRLVNRPSVAIDSVHVVIDREIDTRSISFDRAARAAVVDEEFG